MDKDLKFIIRSFLNFLMRSAYCVAGGLIMMLLAKIDITRSGRITEISFTEFTQEGLLFISAAIFLFLAKKKNSGGLLLVSGFLFCMFIRELDALFDLLFHGAWKYIAVAAAAGFSYAALKKGKAETARTLAEFMRTRSYGMLTRGLLVVLVISRLFGMRELGLFVADVKFSENTKNFMEESTELLGYMLIFAAAVHYVKYCLRPSKDKEE